MQVKTLFSIEMPYRGSLDVKGFSFGSGKPSLAVVGAVRGNEVQQMFTASQLVRRLSRLEEKGALTPGHEILVIPCVNHISMNVGARFWAVDNTDINRMFPGYDQGETTQRIAASLFDIVRTYEHGIQFPSFYLEGDFLPHVRITHVDGIDETLGDSFGMRYVVRKQPTPFDTTTLNYNWRLWDTQAYSIYTGTTDVVNEEAAESALRACLRFMEHQNIIDYPCHRGYLSSHIDDASLVGAHTTRGGIFRRHVHPGDTVSAGEVLADVLSPLTGEVIENVRATCGGVVFFACKTPLVTEHTLAFTLVPRGIDCR